MFEFLKARASDVWKSSNKIQRILLVCAITFSTFAKVLTWYSIKYLGFVEENWGTLIFLKTHGVSTGLVLNGVIVVAGFLLVWLTLGFLPQGSAKT